jgi:hypothetical protein
MMAAAHNGVGSQSMSRFKLLSVVLYLCFFTSSAYAQCKILPFGRLADATTLTGSTYGVVVQGNSSGQNEVELVELNPVPKYGTDYIAVGLRACPLSVGLPVETARLYTIEVMIRKDAQGRCLGRKGVVIVGSKYRVITLPNSSSLICK